MNKNRRLKKGFTLVELVVVIAVIAILAAVSVGAYFGITESANRSADEQAVTQLNKMLETYEILTGRVDDVEEAKDIFEDNGVTNYTPFFDKNTFYWTHADSRVIIWTEGKGVTFPSWAAENYKSYSEQPSVDWYDLNANPNTIHLEADSNNVISYSKLGNVVKNATSNPKIVFENDSVMDIGQANFYFLGNAFKNNANINTIEIDLNGSTMNNTTPHSNGYYYSITIPEGKTLIIENGTINTDGVINTFDTSNHSSLILRNITLHNTSPDNQADAIFAAGNSSEIIIEDCNIDGYRYGVATNAKFSGTPRIVVKNSYISAWLPILLNVVGTVSLENCDFDASIAAVVIRSGSLIARNCKFFTEKCELSSIYYYKNFAEWYGNFGSGTAFPTTTVMLGDYSKHAGYHGDVNARFEKCEFSSDNPYSEMTVPQAVLSADNHTSVVVDFNNCKIDYSKIVQFDVTGECNENCGVSGAKHHEFGCRLTENTGTITINGKTYGYDNYNGYSKYSYNG